MDIYQIPRSFGTHDGTFHADEVTACGLLLLFDLIDWNKIHRTRDPQVLATCEYVCDVGGIYDPSKKLFDHHQVDYQGPMSSAGMILEYLKSIGKITGKDYNVFNKALIMGVDAHDNGMDPQIPGVATYSNVVSNFTPIKHEVTSEEQDKAFYQALEFVYGHLHRFWERYQYIKSCREAVSVAMEPQKKFMLFEHTIPWMDSFFELGGVKHPAEFVVMPSGTHWKLRGVPPSMDDKMKVRKPLPSEWAGLLEEDLKKITGIPGAIFCHKGRFISVWETKEDALKALELVLGKEEITK